jgi:hypothetical protein
MKTKAITHNSLVGISFVTAVILMIPLFAMQVSTEWDWQLPDFIIIGTLIFGTGLLVETVRHKVRNQTKRTAIIIALVLAALFIWAELAVGIFTNLGS